MPTYFTNITNGELGEPATWNTRLQGLENGILAMPTPGIVKFVETTTLTSDQASINVTNIPQTARSLLILLSLRTSAAGLGNSLMRLYFNGYTDAQPIRMYQGAGQGSNVAGHVLLQGNGYDAARPSLAQIRILVPFYRRTVWRKGAIVDSVLWTNGASAIAGISTAFALGTLMDDEAIDEFTIDDYTATNLVKAGTTYAVYGVP